MDRPALMRKTMPELRHIIRRLGADSQPGEGRDSLVHRILLFAPQQWKEEVKAEKRVVPVLVESELVSRLMPLVLQGLKLSVNSEDNTWQLDFDGRTDSGNMAMPLAAVERCARYLMRVAV